MTHYPTEIAVTACSRSQSGSESFIRGLDWWASWIRGPARGRTWNI